MILMIYHTLFSQKLGKMSQNLSCAAVVIGALRVNFEKKISRRQKKKKMKNYPACKELSTQGILVLLIALVSS